MLEIISPQNTEKTHLTLISAYLTNPYLTNYQKFTIMLHKSIFYILGSPFRLRMAVSLITFFIVGENMIGGDTPNDNEIVETIKNVFNEPDNKQMVEQIARGEQANINSNYAYSDKSVEIIDEDNFNSLTTPPIRDSVNSSLYTSKIVNDEN